MSDSLLHQMHDALGKQLLKRIENGTATASDLNVARQFLKDNGIEAQPTGGNSLQGLMEEMPDFDEENDGPVAKLG